MLTLISRYIRLNILSVFNKHPITDKESSVSPFFILSSGRSGSTLLRKILLQTQQVSIPPETHSFIPRLTMIYLRKNLLPWVELVELMVKEIQKHDFFHYWNINYTDTDDKLLKHNLQHKNLNEFLSFFYTKYARTYHPTAQLWGDKTPLLVKHTDILQKVFPSAKYICLIRDGRDVISSFIDHNIYFDIQELSSRWEQSVKTTNALLKKKGSDSVLVIRYEDLVSSPEKELRRICSFLGITFDLRYLENTTVHLGDAIQPHFKGIQDEIHTNNISKWEKLLTTDQIILIEKYIGKTLKDNGYY